MSVILIIAFVYSNSTIVLAKDSNTQATALPKQETTQVQSPGGTDKAVAQPVPQQAPTTQVQQSNNQVPVVPSTNTAPNQPTAPPKESPSSPSPEPAVDTPSVKRDISIATEQSQAQTAQSTSENSNSQELPSVVYPRSAGQDEEDRRDGVKSDEEVSNKEDTSKEDSKTEPSEADSDLAKATVEPNTVQDVDTGSSNNIRLVIKILFGVLWSVMIITLVYLIIKRIRMNCALK